MGEYTYRLSLWVEHPDADLSEVPSRLGLAAKQLWNKGERRVTPKGHDIGGMRQNSYCSIEFDVASATGLPEGVSAALDLLKPHKKYLIELADSGVQLQFFVGWFSEFNSRDVLDWTLLKEMAEMRISLDLDFYGPDPEDLPAAPTDN